MKITPIHENLIKIETAKGAFEVYSLIEGDLQVLDVEGHKLRVELLEKSVVIRVKSK